MNKIKRDKIMVTKEELEVNGSVENTKYKYKLTKVTDDVFNGNHPNGITAGRVWYSDLDLTPTVGERFHFGPKDRFDKYQHVWTSVVTEILEDRVFKTLNSTYKIEEI